MFQRIVLHAMLISGLAAGCGGGSDGDGSSPRTACEEANESLCERFYTCFSAQELAAIGFPSTEAACITMMNAQAGCEAQTTTNACTGNERYNAGEAARCTDQIAGLACSQVRDEDFDFTAAAPACDKVCAVP